MGKSCPAILKAMENSALVSRQYAAAIMEVLEHFHKLTALDFHWMHTEGQMLFTTGGTAVCKAIQQGDGGRTMCRAAMGKAMHIAHQLQESYLFQCPAGLVSLCIPVHPSKEDQSSIFAGPFVLWPWDQPAVEEVLHALDAYQPKVRITAEAIKQTPVCKGQAVRSLGILVYEMAHHACTGMVVAKHMGASADKQAESYRQAQAAILLLEKEKRSYPLQRERELLGKIRMGERTVAKAILNELLGAIFLDAQGDLDIIRMRMGELVAVMSRASVEGGGLADEMFAIQDEFHEKLRSIDQFEQLCRLSVWVLDRFLDNEYRLRAIKNAHCLSDAIRYMQRHFAENLSLDQVASKVFISPYYLSHLFKERLGVTFIEHLTDIRMEKAKGYLAQSSRSLEEIAQRVGYNDTSYFCRVFKKKVGTTASQYRQHVRDEHK